MKERYLLSEKWELLQMAPCRDLDPENIREEYEWIPIRVMPAQVQDVLYDRGMIPEEFRVGWCEKANWITDFDWLYRLKFFAEDYGGKRTRLLFEGLDTYADVYLNGQKILEHSNFYLPDQADLTGLLKEENTLLIHFHRIRDILEERPLKEEWEGHIQACKTIRKPVHDFDPHNKWGSEYQGAVPYFSAIGVYGRIILELYEEEEIQDFHADVRTDSELNGRIRLRLSGSGEAKKLKIAFTFSDAEGNPVLSDEILPECNGSGWKTDQEYELDKPNLWYPRGYGEPYLYRLNVSLISGVEKKDFRELFAGFKNVQVLGSMEFKINDKRVRIWGGSLDPMQGYSHCFDRRRVERMFEMVENGHFNLLRIWGEGIPYPEEFYDMADRKGFLIWQEFFIGYGPIPDSEEYVAEYRKEARALIRRLRHHVSLLMWCGGNETILGAEVNHWIPYGKKVLTDVFPEEIQELDAGRYYLPNSPWYGDWVDDPRSGDVHTLDRILYYPYMSYPNFVTEHCLTAPPAIHSLKKIVKGELFEPGYTSLQKHDTELLMPKNWLTRSSIGSQGQRKSGPWWEFYDADTPEEMVYRFGAAAGKELRRYGEQVRRGSREPADPQFRSKGYITCKLLDTWPKIYCSTIDFFLEGYIPYYTISRLFTPIMLSFQKEESVRLWLVNDSSQKFSGTVCFGTYDLKSEQYVIRKKVKAEADLCDSEIVYDYAKEGFLSRDCVLFAQLRDESGTLLYETVDYLDVERNLKFPDGIVEARMEGNELVIRSDRFIRCVEILGRDGEDEMGWLFEDNYFDLMPGTERRIRVLGQKKHGILSVKGHYCSQKTEVEYQRQ